MRLLKIALSLPLWLVVVAAASPTPPPTTPTPAPTPPTPTPTPVNAFIGLQPAGGGPATQITVTGSHFLPGEGITLFWDDQSRVAGATVADGSGNFTKVVVPFSGDKPGGHRLCVTQPPGPCANFALEGPATPTPADSPTPIPSPSPSPSPLPSPSPSPSLLPAAPPSGLDIISRPPFVFVPIVGLLGVLGVLAYWVYRASRRPPAVPSATVYHRSVRPTLVTPYEATEPSDPQEPAPAAWPAEASTDPQPVLEAPTDEFPALLPGPPLFEPPPPPPAEPPPAEPPPPRPAPPRSPYETWD